MRKKTKNEIEIRSSRLAKMILFSFSLFCFTVFPFTVSAKSQETVSLNFKSTELKKVLNAIEKNSNYRFLFNESILKNKAKIDINVNQAPITAVLNQILSNTGIVYKVMGNKLIVLNEAVNQESLDKLSDVTVTGRVTNANGDPVPGVSVGIKNSRIGVSTNASGSYSITVPDNAVLVFSSVGYETQEVAVAGKTVINVVLKTSEKKIDEVVVIGYGSASKRDLTGSIVKVSGKDIADKPNTNPVASLQSKVPGLYIVNNGTPGQAPDIRIRGTLSIGQVHPLYVVDGILNDNIDYLNPNDIESIEVLKDPSSLAIFGVKGATGVIAITTKRAKAGQTIINLNTSYGFKTLVDKIKMADASQFNTLFAEENANNGVPTPNYSALNANTDWINAVTRTGQFSNTSLSVSTSSEKNKVNLGVGYISDEGIIKREKLTKMLLSFNDEFVVKKGVKMGFNLNVSRQHNPYDATGVLDQARKVMPQVSADTKTFRVKNPYHPNGVDSLNMNIYSGLDVALQSAGVVNPLMELENTWNKTISYENRYVGSVFAEINFLKNFNFRSTWYADVSNVESRKYQPLYYAYNPLTNTPELYSTTTSVDQANSNYKKFQQDYILTFKKKFGDHNLTATGGFTTFYFGVKQLFAKSKQGSGPTDQPIPDDPRLWYATDGFFGKPVALPVSSIQNEAALASFLFRGLYNYKGKYYLNASYRDDGSSQIPKDNRHQSFWAVGAAWEISKEEFMHSIKAIDFLKLKASVGVLGNQSTYSPPGTSLNVSYVGFPNLQTGVLVPFGNNLVSGALPAYQPNPNLKWETVNSSEVGIELNAFNNRLHFEANYYNKVTKDMMTYVDLTSLGLDNKLENGGKIKNWGEEFSATWTQKFTDNLSVNIGGNISFMKNKVLSVAEDLPGGYISRGFANNGSAESRTIEGYPIGAFWGYVVDGIYQSNLDILNSPPASALGSYRPGDFKFKDTNGDGVIDAKDRVMIGNPSPDFIYGGSINVNYKRFNLGVDFGGVYGNEVFRVWGSLESPFQRVNYPAFKTERWHGAGTSNWEPIISQGDRFNYNGSTYNIEDGSYFRIRNLQVGYNLEPRLLTKLKIKSLRLYANVQNLKTWKHNEGYTAEFGGDATGFGFDFAGGAIPRVTTFGLNVTF